MTGCFPFPNSVTEADLIERIKVANFDYTSSKFVSYSQKAIDLVQNMLKVRNAPWKERQSEFQVDPATRIAAGEISKSAWVQGFWCLFSWILLIRRFRTGRQRHAKRYRSNAWVPRPGKWRGLALAACYRLQVTFSSFSQKSQKPIKCYFSFYYYGSLCLCDKINRGNKIKLNLKVISFYFLYIIGIW